MPSGRPRPAADQEVWSGVSKLGDRSFVNAVVYVLKTGAPWRDLPERFGPWKSVYNRFSNWVQGRPLEADLQGAAAEGGPPWKPGRCDDRAGTPGFGGSKRGPAVNCLGRSRGGFSTKVHALSDAQGRPDPRRIDGWPDSRSDGRSRAARTRRRPSVHRRHRIRRGTDSSSGGRSRDEGCDPLASHEGDRASTRQEALPDPLPHRVSVSPPQALSSARDPLRKDRSQLPCVRPSGLAL